MSLDGRIRNIMCGMLPRLATQVARSLLTRTIHAPAAEALQPLCADSPPRILHGGVLPRAEPRVGKDGLDKPRLTLQVADWLEHPPQPVFSTETRCCPLAADPSRIRLS